ncbi:MAG: hypothetical protein HZA31_11685 [Opitutae bacterium]|nr:hypothetical protein [Opitutae bacterium]
MIIAISALFALLGYHFAFDECGITRVLVSFIGWLLGGGIGLMVVMLSKKAGLRRLFIGALLYLVGSAVSLIITVALLEARVGWLSLSGLLIAPLIAVLVAKHSKERKAQSKVSA